MSLSNEQAEILRDEASRHRIWEANGATQRFTCRCGEQGDIPAESTRDWFMNFKCPQANRLLIAFGITP